MTVRGLIGWVCVALLGVLSPVVQANEGVVVAMAYFDNNSKDAQYDNLQKGIADMLITKLAVADGLRVVERSRLESLLKEIELGEGPYLDPKTAQQMGEGLGAELMITGAFVVMDGQYRVDARVIMVESSEVITAVEVSGELSAFFTLQTQLAETLLNKLGAELVPLKRVKIKRSPTQDFRAFSHYSDGLSASDRGDKSAAKKAFTAALKSDPNFKAAQERLSELEERVTRLEQSGGLVLTPKTAMDHYFNSRIHSKRGKLTEALDSLSQAIKIKPDAADVLVDFANIQRTVEPEADLGAILKQLGVDATAGPTVRLLQAISEGGDSFLRITPTQQPSKLALADLLFVQLAAQNPDRPSTVAFKRSELASIRRIVQHDELKHYFLDASRYAAFSERLGERVRFYDTSVWGHGRVSSLMGQVVIAGGLIDPNVSEDSDYYDLLIVPEPHVEWAKLTFMDGTECVYQQGEPSHIETLKSQVTTLRTVCRPPIGFATAKIEVLGWGGTASGTDLGQVRGAHSGVNTYSDFENGNGSSRSSAGLHWSFDGDFGTRYRFSHLTPEGLRVAADAFSGSQFKTVNHPELGREGTSQKVDNGVGREGLPILPHFRNMDVLPSRWMSGVGLVDAANASVITPIYYWLPTDSADVPHGLHTVVWAHPDGKDHEPFLKQNLRHRAWTALMALMAGDEHVAADVLDHALLGRGELYQWFWMNAPSNETQREVTTMLYSLSRGGGPKSKMANSLVSVLEREWYPFFSATVDYADGRLNWEEYLAKARECGEQQDNYTPAYFEGQAVINAILKDKGWATNAAISAQVERSLIALDLTKYSDLWWWNWLRAQVARHRARTLPQAVEIPAYSGQIGSVSVWSEEKPFTHPALHRALKPDRVLAARKVSVSTFWLDRTEVGASEFRACIEAGACSTHKKYIDKDICSYSDVRYRSFCGTQMDEKRTFPVSHISQEMAANYCNWRGGRLPSLDEWQVAARRGPVKPKAGTPTTHWSSRTGNHIDQVTCRILGPEWTEENRPCASAAASSMGPWDGHAGMAPVGAHPLGATTEGVEGLFGNLSEWVTHKDEGVEAAGCHFAMPSSDSGMACERVVVRFRGHPERTSQDILNNRGNEEAALKKKLAERKAIRAELNDEYQRAKTDNQAAKQALRLAPSKLTRAKSAAKRASAAVETARQRLEDQKREAADFEGVHPAVHAAILKSLPALEQGLTTLQSKLDESTAAVKAAEEAASSAVMNAETAKMEFETLDKKRREHAKETSALERTVKYFRNTRQTDEERFSGRTIGFRCAYDKKPKD